MMKRCKCSAVVIGGTLFAQSLYSQFGTESVADRDIGRPPRPPLITFLGIVSPGKLVTDLSLPPIGPVAETLYEELRGQPTPAGPAGEVVSSARTTYNSDGLPVEDVRTEFGSQASMISTYQGKRLVSQESTYPATPVKFWEYWTYDQVGKLTEYRRGRGKEIENHDLNFTRDGEGRLTGFEYRQGPKDEPGQRTAIIYSDAGKTATTIHYNMQTGEETDSLIQKMDDEGRVIHVEIRERDWQTKKPKTPLGVTFRYDQKGRLVEQNTDPHEFERAGSEEELPPGKISIAYDDVKQTKTTEYKNQEGSLTSTLTLDGNGATIGIIAGTPGELTNIRIDCVYDDHGNWTTCRQVAQVSGINTVGKTWRRTITYR